MLVAACSACGSTEPDPAMEMEPQPPPIPLACEGVELPAERGQDTMIGHHTTVASFDLESLRDWLGVTPDPEQGILVLASHPEYDCNRLVHDRDFDYSQPFTSQLVYLFPGPIEAGTYELGVDDLRVWAANQLGDGMGNGGSSEGELSEGSITIETIQGDCMTGLKAFSSTHDDGFAIADRASCN